MDVEMLLHSAKFVSGPAADKFCSALVAHGDKGDFIYQGTVFRIPVIPSTHQLIADMSENLGVDKQDFPVVVQILLVKKS